MAGKVCLASKQSKAPSLSSLGVAISRSLLVSLKQVQLFLTTRSLRRKWKTTLRWYRFPTKQLKSEWGMTSLKTLIFRLSWLSAWTLKELIAPATTFCSTTENSLRFMKLVSRMALNCLVISKLTLMWLHLPQTLWWWALITNLKYAVTKERSSTLSWWQRTKEKW